MVRSGIDRVIGSRVPTIRSKKNGENGRPGVALWSILVLGGLLIRFPVQGALAADPPAAESVSPRPLAPLPETSVKPNAEQVALGRLLFFDGRLSGDSTISCATCHQPAKAWCDGLPLSRGYPGSLYFRNTPTLLNAALKRHVFWDGRLPADDLPTVVRDHISEAHFMQADGRLVIERCKQVPDYVERFQEAFGGEPTYGRILNSVAAFVSTLQSRNAPVDRFLAGDQGALPEDAQRGLTLFQGKAGCIRCHDGPLLSNGKFYDLGVPTNPDVFSRPMRHITFRRFFRTLGVSDFEHLRDDVGLYAITKVESDRGRFQTPSLREVGRTAPYMHNGMFKTLQEVVAFYNQGGGLVSRKNSGLVPLGLSPKEQSDLVAFLKGLTGDPQMVRAPQLPAYELLPARSRS